MTSRRRAGRSLQKRLALAYAAGIYAAGVLVVVFVDVPLVGIDAAVPKDGSAPTSVTTSGISLPQLLVGSAVALVVLIPVALALGWYVAGRFLRPLRAITATARSISAGDLHRRLGLGGPADELTELGHTLDDLFARLEAAFDAQRHFVANASHELRTPLAGLRTLLEVALADPDADADDLRAVCQEALALGEHQERLVRALLALATSERGIGRLETLDLARVTRQVLASRRDEAARTGVELTGQLAPAMTAGDPGLVESLIANLIDNAIRHNRAGGHVKVITHPSGEGTVRAKTVEAGAPEAEAVTATAVRAGMVGAEAVGATAACAAASDTGTSAARAVGAGAVEAGAVEAGAVEAGAVEAVEAGAVEAGAVEAGTVEAGTVEAGAVEAGTVEAGTVDTRVVEVAGPHIGAVVTIVNSGPVVPPGQVRRLFQPFQRLAPERHGRRDGYGLGLAIVDAVARAHRATITAAPRPEGGLTVTVEFGRGLPPAEP
ncbi:sensor histidine kinase [[Actinomadura] parvosata]|uniref:sensor histidine kinase n=1 Tax=[Actinomadura] parvosata TaxID=1955412 RepID=UPI001FEB153F